MHKPSALSRQVIGYPVLDDVIDRDKFSEQVIEAEKPKLNTIVAVVGFRNNTIRGADFND